MGRAVAPHRRSHEPPCGSAVEKEELVFPSCEESVSEKNMNLEARASSTDRLDLDSKCSKLALR